MLAVYFALFSVASAMNKECTMYVHEYTLTQCNIVVVIVIMAISLFGETRNNRPKSYLGGVFSVEILSTSRWRGNLPSAPRVTLSNYILEGSTEKSLFLQIQNTTG